MASAAAPSVEEKPPYFITTPIYYVNGNPHIGHAYTTLACDVLARFKRLDGHEVKFLTGTDEHGQKVEQSATAAGETPQAFADRVSASFRELTGAYDFSCDEFIRTTEPRHREAAQALWCKLLDAGDIYLGAYEGWYSVRDECFYTEDELVDGNAPTGAPVEWVAESSYFFRLSKYAEPLIAYIRENDDFIKPMGRRNEVLSFMREGLRDLSISRTTFGWGIPVPADPSKGEGSTEHEGHVMYVWLDALTNYITALGYPDTEGEQFQKYWPASVHMVGKDILRFHAIYWPALLMAAGLPLPQKLFAHGWWMNDGEKMSKSIGNVIDPYEIVETYGVDQVRYFMINEVPFGSDGDFSSTRVTDCINAKLSNDLGNLAYRTLSFAYKHCGQATPTPTNLNADDEEMLSAARGLLPEMRSLADSMMLHRMTKQMNMVVQQANRYIDTQAPWALKKTDEARMQTVLWVLMETLRHVGILQLPVTPTISNLLLDQIACPEGQRTFAYLAPEYALQAGTPLPKPAIIVPRYEPPEEEAAAAEGGGAGAAAAEAPPAAELGGEELAALEAQIKAQGERVRDAKAGGDKAAVEAEVAGLLALKAQLPAGHELLSGGKKKKKSKSAA
jgi:methionyl-tRNA synthetase